MAEEFAHERLTEAHDLQIAFSFRIEIGTAFAATHGKRREAVLEHLLECEKLENAEIDGGMKT